MKILHTSDWHLGHKLYKYDRADEEGHFFRQLEAVVEKEQPDALLVSGDVFDIGTPGNDVAKVFTERLLDVQSKCRTMETVVIAGNHDSYSRLVIDQALWNRCRVHVLGVPCEKADGRADFDGSIVRIADRGLVAAVPFCHERNFPIVEGSEDDDRMCAYFRGLARRVDEVARPDGVRRLPCVLMTHLAVGRDTDLTGHDTSLMIGGQACVEKDSLGAGYDYIALGHIHCPQWVGGGGKTARYCGTPRAVHFDETYGHGVDVIEVESGREPVVKTVPFAPLRPLKTVGGGSGVAFEKALEDLGALQSAPGTYVRLNVAMGANELGGADWLDRARQVSAARGFRFCCINPVRTTQESVGPTSARALSVEELRNLTDERVVEILSEKRHLSERQVELLKDLLKVAGA